MLCLSSCATVRHWHSNRWIADYDKATRIADKSELELLIYYVDDRPGTQDKLRDLLQDDALRSKTEQYTRCKLLRSFEPDRRFVAQYGIDRAPALLVIHKDGTYHAIEGVVTSTNALEFLHNAAAPGVEPLPNPLVPRKAQYTWLENIDVAQQISKLSGSPLLVVYHRPYTKDWWRIEALLREFPVFKRLKNATHCRVGVGTPWQEAFISPFGAIRLPAVVLVSPDGAYRVLEKPTSYEAIVHFTDQNKVATSTPRSSAATGR